MEQQPSQIIPKVIHQIWIGHLPPPLNLLRTWKEKNPDYEYILWDEAGISHNLPNLTCKPQIDAIPEINGKADILRWEILYEYGGFFFDADSVCITPLLEEFREIPGNGFSCFENETMREGLIACGSMGFIPKHPLIKRILDSIKDPNNQHLLITTRAWYSVGPGVLTRAQNEAPEEEKITIFPSHMFLPRHHTGLTYTGHERVYAYQFWGTNDRSYGMADKMVVPQVFIQTPERWVSVFITSFNTNAEYIYECLQSIQSQTGDFGIELVWVNDGSTPENTQTVKNYLNVFHETSRFVCYKYLENSENLGCRRSLRLAVENCSHDLIFKMDADDIMLPQRIALQMKFMDENPNAPCCGGQMDFFNDGQIIKTTKHPTEITWNNWVQTKTSWFMNHPTLCFRKDALLSIGNYPDTPISKEHPEQNMMDDYEIELKLLKKYGQLYNLPDTLLKYRVHPEQMTQKFQDTDERLQAWREEIIRKILGKEPTGIHYEIKEIEQTPVVQSSTAVSKTEPEIVVDISPVISQEVIPSLSHFVYI